MSKFWYFLLIVPVLWAVHYFSLGNPKTDAADQPMPLTDGASLAYSVSLDSGGTHIDDDQTYTFKKIGDDWQVTVNSANISSDNQDFTMDASDRISVFADQEHNKSLVGKVYKDIWLPPNKRVGGASVSPLFVFGDYTVGEKTRWGKWSVWPASDSEETLYFEASSGWLVGKELKSGDGPKRTETLSSASVSIPSN